MNVYCLYFPNGKRYFGIESRKGKRIRHHAKGYDMRSTRPQVVTRAIVKYGWDSVQWRYLFTNLSLEEGAKIEIFLIRHFNTQNPVNGYNVTAGGDLGMTGLKMSPEAKAKISKASTGRKHTEDARKKMSDALMGHPVSPETIEKLRLAKMGKPRPRGYKRGPSPMKGVKRPGFRNSGSFAVGKPAPNKGRTRLIGPDGKMRYYTKEQILALGLAIPQKTPKQQKGITTQMNTPEMVAKRTASRREADARHILLPNANGGRTRFRPEQFI